MKPISKHSESWPLIPFARIIEESAFGPRFSGDYYDVNGNVATLRTTDLQDDGRISYETMPFARLNNEQFQKHYLKAGDLVITRSGTCGIAAVFVGFTSPVVPGAFLIRFRLTKEAIPKFYAYYFNSPQGRANVLSVAAGAVQQNLNSTNLANLLVPRPSVATQRTVARILSTYDDLIENNLRRIKILEQMAQMIYREWFVDFRFPGHGKFRTVASESGRLPDGWDASALGEVATVNERSIKDNPPEEISYIDIASVSTGSVNSVARLPFRKAPGRARRVVREGDTIWSTVRPNRKSFALILRPDANLIVSTGFAVLSPRTIPYSYLYFATTTDEFTKYLTNHATGSAYPAVNSKDFEAAKIVVPPKVLLDKFHNAVEPMLKLRHVLRMRNAILGSTRDLLLPKLVSGEVNVEQIETGVPAQTV